MAPRIHLRNENMRSGNPIAGCRGCQDMESSNNDYYRQMKFVDLLAGELESCLVPCLQSSWPPLYGRSRLELQPKEDRE
jgi:hypothetical protein